MIKIPKKLLTFTFITLAACSLIGCGKKKEEKEEVVNYELTAYQEDELVSETYYIKTEKGYYPVAPGTRSFEEGEHIATEVSNDRMVWYGPDDVQIPTLYKDQELVFVTNLQIPTEWTFERYEDLGYTIGVRSFQENSGGRIETELDYTTIHPLSSAYQEMCELNPGTILGINKIGTTIITPDYISRGGTIRGLTQGQTYSCDVYIGSNYYNSQLIADTHAFASFELYKTTEYQYNQANYITIKVPDFFYSGYYYINGLGMFKYVANKASDGISGENFNAPYYVGIDDKGNLLNAEEFELYMKNKDIDTAETVAEEEEEQVWNSILNIDRTMDSIEVTVSYKNIEKELNIVEEQTSAQLVQAQQLDEKTPEEEAAPPEISLISPSGETHIFAEDSSKKNDNSPYTFYSCSVQMPESGQWIVKMKGMEERLFTVETNIGSGESNSLVHSGSGTAQLNYYLKNAMKDALFTFTWENTEHACTIEIIAPDNTHFTEDDYETISSGYGQMQLRLGTLIAGEYTIKITGEDLGRIRCDSSEYTKTSDESTENDNDTEFETGEETDEETDTDEDSEPKG